MLTGDQQNRASSSAPNAATSGSTSGIAASASPTAPTALSGIAITAASPEATGRIHAKHQGWIEARGISVDLAQKLGLETVMKDGAAWLSVPYVERGRTINHKYRLTSEKRHQMDSGAPLTLWNHDTLLDETDQPLVICEGEWDAMVALDLGWRAVSVPNGAPAEETEDVANAGRYSYLWRSRELLNRVKSFIIATDDDPPGRALRQDLVALLGADRCSFVEYPFPAKDLNEALLEHGRDAVHAALRGAKQVPVRGLFKLRDFPEPGPLQSMSIGILGLDEYIRLVLGTLTVMTGWAGQGKTSLIMAIMGHLIRSGVSVTLGSFETQPRPILERKLRAAILQCGEHELTGTKVREADELIDKHLTLIAQMVGEEDEMTLEDVLDRAEIAVKRDGCRVLFLDPWNEIEHKRRRDETETEYAARALRKIRNFAVQHQVAVWLVAHPAKPSDGSARNNTPGLYSISGSANWANKPDYGLVFTRNKETNVAKIHIVKVRMGYPGKEGDVELRYDWRTSSYAPLSGSAPQ